jgi:hypothetical protein
MRRITTSFLAALLVCAGAAMARGTNRTYGNDNMNIHLDSDANGDVTDCSQVVVQFDGKAAVRSSEDLPGAAGLRSLRLHAPSSGGVRVNGWNGSGYSVKACKAAALASDLASVHVSLRNDEVVTEGGDEGGWVVFFLVQAPRGATLDLESRNGPIDVRNVNAASLTASAKNGPVSILDCSGTMDVSTQNGPISLAGGSGNMKLAAKNGPLSVRLSGSTWEGGQLDARTQNGPVSLRLPGGYRSGVVIESDGHAPISGRAEACGAARRSIDVDEDDDSNGWTPLRLEFGSGSTLVHLSTKNGPVSVKDGE